MKPRVLCSFVVTILLLSPVAAQADNFAFKFAFGTSC